MDEKEMSWMRRSCHGRGGDVMDDDDEELSWYKEELSWMRKELSWMRRSCHG